MDPAILVVATEEHPLIDIDLTVLVQFGLFLVMLLLLNQLLFKPYLRLREKRQQGRLDLVKRTDKREQSSWRRREGRSRKGRRRKRRRTQLGSAAEV